MIEPKPRPGTGLRRIRGSARETPLRARLGGPWRVALTEASMAPTILPGDWLLIDPTTARWPRRGAIVVIREPDTEVLAIKRLAAGPGDRVELDAGHLLLASDEAWLLSDARDADLLAAGAGAPIDSRRYGPVPVANLVGRAWFRYGPASRIGRLAGRPVELDPAGRGPRSPSG